MARLCLSLVASLPYVATWEAFYQIQPGVFVSRNVILNFVPNHFPDAIKKN